MEISGLDHFVLTATDIEETCEFYSTILDLEIRRYGDNRTALHFGDQKINVHDTSERYSFVAKHPTPGSHDFCFRTPSPIEEIVDRLHTHDIDIIKGPVERTGANGTMTSVYCRDPDDNLVEIATYSS